MLNFLVVGYDGWYVREKRYNTCGRSEGRKTRERESVTSVTLDQTMGNSYQWVAGIIENLDIVEGL